MPSKISAFFYWSFMKSQEKNQCKNQTLCHSKGIEVPSNISCSFFTEASWKVKNKFNVKTKRCITVLALKCHCLQFFYWSFMKSQEQNQCKETTLYHSLGIKMPLKICYIFCWSFIKSQLQKTLYHSPGIDMPWKNLSSFFFLKLHENKRTKSMKEENVASQSGHWNTKFWI